MPSINQVMERVKRTRPNTIKEKEQARCATAEEVSAMSDGEALSGTESEV